MSSTDSPVESLALKEGHWAIVRRDSSQSPKRLHLPDPRDDSDGTLCNDEERQGGSVVLKDTAAIPPGYYPVCQDCTAMAQEVSR